jgi:predicted membrane protein
MYGRPMNVSIIGRRIITLPNGWTDEGGLNVIGSSRIDAAAATPGEGAKLSLYSIVGGIDVVVPRGARVRLEGFSLLGSRRVEVTPGDGPEITINAISIVGRLRVTEA